MSDTTESKGLVIPRANPGTTWTWIVSLILAVLKPIFAVLTPTIRDELRKLLESFYAKAETTDNPWDDFLAEFLLKILGYDVPGQG